MDRFTEQSPADLQRSYRLSSRCFRDEDGIIDGFYQPVVDEDDYEELYVPDDPLCPTGAEIVHYSFSSISEYLRALDLHRRACLVCSGRVYETKRRIERKGPQSELFVPKKEEAA